MGPAPAKVWYYVVTMLSRDTDLIDEMLAVNPNSLHLQKGEIAVRCEGGALKPDIFTGISTWCAGTAPIPLFWLYTIY